MDKSELAVTIPIPCHVPRARGIYSTQQFGVIVRTRLHRTELELITQEATELGVTISAFFRWCAVQTAKELQRARSGPSRHSKDRPSVS